MKEQSNVIVRRAVTAEGVALGALAVLAFSFSLPATRLAVGELDPWFVAFGRAVGAGVLALVFLRWQRAPRPSVAQLRRLVLVATGIVVAFPLFTSLALRVQTSAHGAVVIAGLPMATAVFAVARGGERPSRQFWLASAAGLVAVLVFVATTGAVSGGIERGDVFLLLAVALCGMGYAEGGALARELGGARTVCWALVIALPVTVPIAAVVATAADFGEVGPSAWFGFGYLTVVSMFLGFFAWYAGMARGGVAKVGQVQLAQPVLTLAWSALLLHERVTLWTAVAALVVLGCVVQTQRGKKVQEGRAARSEVSATR